MSGLGAWIWGTSQLDDAIDKATSELLPSGGEDIALNLEICDQIRSKSVPAKDAMRALKRRMNHKNPNVQLLTLSLTDVCIKNGGDLFLSEVASREFMDNLVSILKIPALNHDVKQNILRFIQNWSIAFEGKPNLSYVGQVYKTLLNEGYKFPPKDLAVANSAMVDTQTAPEWIDSEVCLRCRTAFTFTNRKHHCRNCGQVFDQACSSKTMALPHFGITQEVRVCDSCYSKLQKKAEKADKGRRHSTSAHGHRHKSARELADMELQRAIQLSLEEVNGPSKSRPGYVPAQPYGYSEPPIVDRTTYPTRKAAVADDEDDPDLKAAIEASLREAAAPKPSAPVVVETPRFEEAPYSYAGPGYSQSYPPAATSQPSLPKVPNYDLEPLEEDAILTFSQTVEQVQAQGGRDMSRLPAVNELYDKANGLRPKLALSLDDAGRKEEILTDMHDKLTQAVQLYDQILTQQLARPRWRAPAAPVSPSPYQQQQQTYGQYSSWAPQQSNQAAYQAQPDTRQMSPQATYSSPAPLSVRLTAPDAPGIHQHQGQYQSQHAQYASLPAQSTPSAPPPQSPQYTQQYQQYAPPPPPASIQSPTSYSTPIPHPPSNQFASPAPPPAHPQSEPSQYVPPAPPMAPTSVSPNQQNSYVPSNYASPPPQQQQILPPIQQQAQHTYQGGQQQPIPAALPQFPSAPTAIPQPSFPAYGSSISPGFEKKEERKEALLIDL